MQTTKKTGRNRLLERGLPVHLVHHLATMADLHRGGTPLRRKQFRLAYVLAVPIVSERPTATEDHSP